MVTQGYIQVKLLNVEVEYGRQNNGIMYEATISTCV
jgi:hypothetical protein